MMCDPLSQKQSCLAAVSQTRLETMIAGVSIGTESMWNGLYNIMILNAKVCKSRWEHNQCVWYMYLSFVEGGREGWGGGCCNYMILGQFLSGS